LGRQWLDYFVWVGVMIRQIGEEGLAALKATLTLTESPLLTLGLGFSRAVKGNIESSQRSFGR
jgi:hypothetical protein